MLLYVWQAVVQPLVFGAELGDFQGSYMRAAARLAAGRDPFDLCQTMGCLEPTGPQYVTPLPLAWLLQPAVGVDSHAVTVAAALVLNVSGAIFLFFPLRARRGPGCQMAPRLSPISLSFRPPTA